MKPGWLHKTPGYILSLAAGAVTCLAFAPAGLAVLAIFMPALLAAAWLHTTPRSAFVHGYLFGLGLFGFGVNWLHISINLFGGVNFAGAVLLTFLFIAFISLYPAVTGCLSRKYFNRSGAFTWLVIVLPATWVLMEWLRGWLFTGFPWLNLGYSQTDTPLASLAPIIGVYGMSWVIMLTAGLVVALFAGAPRQRLLSLVMLALIGAGSWLLESREWTQDDNRDIDIALVQGAVPQAVKWHPRMRETSMRLYRDLTQPYLGHDLIIWPETAIPAFYHQVSDYLHDIASRARNHGSRVLVGIPFRDPDSGNYYNSILSLQEEPARYDKRHLVPFGEYLPVKSLLDEILRFLKIPISDFTPGNAVRPLLSVNGIHIGVSICYEDAFGEEVIEALPEANILVNVSNDAWFGDSFAPHQHLQMARMRALESERYMLRATNTGVSALIDEKGKILKTTPQFDAAVLSGRAQLRSGATPYAVTGNSLVVNVAFLLLLAVGVLQYRSRVRGKE
ncbi:MAG: apolipoprotein N-acyltransferase [Gammaproteobacteria bacterium]